MTDAFLFIPVFVAIGIFSLIPLAAVSDTVDNLLSQLAHGLFREAVERHGRNQQERQRLLHAVHAESTYPQYASRTLLMSSLVGMAVSSLGTFIAFLPFSLGLVSRDVLPTLPSLLPLPPGAASTDPTSQILTVFFQQFSALSAAGADLPGMALLSVLAATLGKLFQPFAALFQLLVVSFELLVLLLSTVAAGLNQLRVIAPQTGDPVAILAVIPQMLFSVILAPVIDTFGIPLLLFLGIGVVLGSIGFGLTYYVRWQEIKSQAQQREILIDESVARTIAFIYALSRSGMLHSEVMRTVGENRKAFGECAEEIGVIVKDMDLFGSDLVAALERVAFRTPSEQFSDFAENFANVLRSGRNVSSYLREQYDKYQQERVANQERLLELFTALGEGYVAVLVAGPLFLLTVLIIFGILTGGMIDVLRVIVFVMIPIANTGFVLYLGKVSEPLTAYRAPIKYGNTTRGISVRRADGPGEVMTRTDGGTAAVDPEANLRRLRVYNRLRRFKTALANPFATFVQRPITVLYVTVPIALLVFVVRGLGLQGGFTDLRMVDDLLIQSGLFVIATFAAVRTIHSRRLRDIERAVPDLLERLASTNEAGLTFTESLNRVDRSDLGPLNVEVDRLIADITWGARTETALYRFNQRIGSTTVARVVALITNAMSASGQLGPVLRIASDEAREDRRLKRTRRQEMFMYVVIIYLAFFIFLGIAAALEMVLIPAIPNADQLGGVSGGGVGGGLPLNPVGEEEKAAYTLVLFHAAVVQSLCSGFVAGQMGEGSVKDGAKHVTVLLIAAYLVFTFVL